MSKLISIGQIIDQSWSHYTKHFQQLMKVSLWFFLVPLVLLVGSIFAPIVDPTAVRALTATETIGLIINLIGSIIVAPVVGVWVGISLVKMIDAQSNKRKVDLKKQSQESWKLFLSYIWVGILKGIAVLLPTLLIVPGLALIILNIGSAGGAAFGAFSIILTFFGTLAAVVLMVKLSVELAFPEFEVVLHGEADRKARGIGALKNSRALVKGRFWATFIRILIPNALFAVAVILIQYAIVFFYRLALGYLANLGDVAIIRIDAVVQSVLGFGIAALSTPLFVIVGYMIYDSLRKTK